MMLRAAASGDDLMQEIERPSVSPTTNCTSNDLLRRRSSAARSHVEVG